VNIHTLKNLSLKNRVFYEVRIFILGFFQGFKGVVFLAFPRKGVMVSIRNSRGAGLSQVAFLHAS